MRNATVLYLADAPRIAPGTDPTKVPRQLGLDPEWTEIAGSAPGWPSVQDALLRLVERGAARVALRLARPGPSGQMELSGACQRLFG